jgi:hypothetical protein
MATQDDDALNSAVPEPGAAPAPGELAHARRFADLVDKTLAGRTPPAMSADDRALLEVATVIRATRGQIELDADRQRAVVEDALRLAIGASRATPARLPVPSAARTGRRRLTPWLVSGASALVAAVAIATLWLRSPGPVAHGPARPALPVEWTSRSADALIGPIARDRSGDAAVRIDEIFADRLDGFRARRLTRGGRP